MGVVLIGCEQTQRWRSSDQPAALILSMRWVLASDGRLDWAEWVTCSGFPLDLRNHLQNLHETSPLLALLAGRSQSLALEMAAVENAMPTLTGGCIGFVGSRYHESLPCITRSSGTRYLGQSTRQITMPW